MSSRPAWGTQLNPVSKEEDESHDGALAWHARGPGFHGQCLQKVIKHVKETEHWLRSGGWQRSAGMSQEPRRKSVQLPLGYRMGQMSDLLGAGRESQAGTHSERFLFSEKTRRMNSPS